jgi:hypothetical protein
VAKSDWIDVVDERSHPVDLDDGQPFAVGRLELRVAGDVDLVEGLAAFRAVETNARYG